MGYLGTTNMLEDLKRAAWQPSRPGRAGQFLENPRGLPGQPGQRGDCGNRSPRAGGCEYIVARGAAATDRTTCGPPLEANAARPGPELRLQTVAEAPGGRARRAGAGALLSTNSCHPRADTTPAPIACAPTLVASPAKAGPDFTEQESARDTSAK